MSALVIADVLLSIIAASLAAVWYELREMRKRAGMMPLRKPKPVDRTL